MPIDIQIHYLKGYSKSSKKACGSPLALESPIFLPNRKAKWEVKLPFSCKMRKLIYESEAISVSLIINTLLGINFNQKNQRSPEEHRTFIKVLLLNTYQVAVTLFEMHISLNHKLCAEPKRDFHEWNCHVLTALSEGDLREFQIIKAFTLQKQEIEWKAFKHILFLQA